MFPKKNRADRNEITKIFKEGKFLNGEILTLKFILNNNSNLTRFSFVAPKTVTKSAVKRNLLRRRGYVVLEKYLNNFPVGILGAFVFKKSPPTLIALENDIKFILNKL